MDGSPTSTPPLPDTDVLGNVQHDLSQDHGLSGIDLCGTNSSFPEAATPGSISDGEDGHMAFHMSNADQSSRTRTPSMLSQMLLVRGAIPGLATNGGTAIGLAGGMWSTELDNAMGHSL